MQSPQKELLIIDKETPRLDIGKSIESILSPNQDKFISINDLNKKYRLADDIKKINEQSYENSTEMLKANNSKNMNLTLSNASRIDRDIKYSSIDNTNFVNLNKHVNINLKENNKSMNNQINININNNTNFYMIKGDKDFDKYSSLDRKVLKSILKNKPSNGNIQAPPLNMNKSIAKSVKKVLIEDQIMPTCIKTKSFSILSISNLNLDVN